MAGFDIMKNHACPHTMRVAALVMALNAQKVCPLKDFDTLNVEHKKLWLEHENLESEFEAYKDKYIIQVGYMEDLCKAHDKIREIEAGGKEVARAYHRFGGL